MSTSTSRRRLTGIVVSDKMMKTVVVRVDRVATHPKYHKQYTVSKRYKAHDPLGQYHRGDRVTIVASRPRSAEKRWEVLPTGNRESIVTETGT